MATNWQIGDRIQGRWEIYKVLKGGMGIVYVVYDHEHPNAYAAKTFQDEIFDRDPAIAERFTQETLTWVNLDAHQNIAQALFVETIHGKPYLFLEYVSGGDLGDWIGTLRLTEDLPQVLRFAIQFCDGMTHAQSKGIQAHRDIKPQNCLITEDRTLKVTDFGLAKMLDHANPADAESPGGESLSIEFTRTRVAGTPHYMSPEQFDKAKRVDVRADIYSFGVMLYQMLTGRLPFVGRTWQEFQQLHESRQPPALGSPHSTLKTVIETCLAKDPAHRFADFSAVREELTDRYEVLTGEIARESVRGAELTAAGWNTKGVSLSELGHSEEAVACYDRALAINPRYVTAWTNKGVALDRLDRLEEALSWFDRVLAINPRDSIAWINKGSALHGSGRSEEAIACFEEALAINPRDEQVWSNKGLVLGDLGRFEEAIECCDRAFEINPRYAKVWTNKGVVLGELDRWEESIACFDHALAIDPRDEKAWTNKGFALDSLGRSEEAIACYDRALAINPRLAPTWWDRALALIHLGRLEEAIADCDKGLAINPRSAETWHSKGVALSISQRPREALVCFEEAHRLGYPKAALAIALLRQALGE
jgi:tetratricopeptide (TPR) repeat protein